MHEGLSGMYPYSQRVPTDDAGLYAGLLPTLLQSVLTAAFMFVAQRRVYELVKKVSTPRASG
jgi:hypothetical protein